MKSIIIILMLMPALASAEWFGRVDASHTSNYSVIEKGYGLNALFLDIGYKTKHWYMYGGVGVHNETFDCPEVCFGGSKLARFGAGYTWSF